SAAALYILTKGPPHLRESLMRSFQNRISQTRLIHTLKWILGLTAGLEINNLLSSWARNNWQTDSQKQWNWQLEVAVVTGGSGGIGELIVKGLAAKGIKVAVLDVQTPSESLSKLENVRFYQCNITSKDEVDRVAAEIKEALGPVSILCNNAGIAHAHTLLESSPEYLRKLFDVNVISQFYTLQAFLPHMIAQKKGHIVSTASLASFITCAGLVDYAATKAAVLAIHEGLAQELKYRYNAPQIKLSIVHPIYVRTKLVTSYAQSLERSKALQIEPEMVANAVVKQILSKKSGQITLPGWMGIFSALKGLPWWFQEMIR
ncbi:NAD(P)-binding protein, partial [Tothia fuscella]